MLERRHHNCGPNTGSLAPGVRQRAKKTKKHSLYNFCLVSFYSLRKIEHKRLNYIFGPIGRRPIFFVNKIISSCTEKQPAKLEVKQYNISINLKF